MDYEYFVVALASALAGIGTGLVGLSAATAMVPLLIVLCPSFGGEHGAYQYVFDQVLLYGAGTYRVSFMAKGEEVSEGAQVGAGLSWHYNANVLPDNFAPLSTEWKKYTFDIPLEESQIRPSKKMGMAIISRNGEKLLVDDVEMTFVGK